MFREFFSVFRSDDPLSAMGERFTRMLGLTSDMALAAARIYFDGASPEGRQALYEQDIQVNKLEREIRKLIVTHLSVRSRPVDVPYCLLLLSLIKDVERLGDYAKNLAELTTLGGGPPPDDALGAELRAIRAHVEMMFRDTPDVLTTADRDRAVKMIEEGRGYTKRCDELMKRVAASGYDSPVAVSMALGGRYYKRFAAHLLNLLTSVVMPLHKLDFFDEKAVVQE
ncbi:MAG: hypothetical protein OEY20_12975 [Gemmatimonadota bacterium]|nr:hypothetical protein [Gemmatimonadota bacterium]